MEYVHQNVSFSSKRVISPANDSSLNGGCWAISYACGRESVIQNLDRYTSPADAAIYRIKVTILQNKFDCHSIEALKTQKISFAQKYKKGKMEI